MNDEHDPLVTVSVLKSEMTLLRSQLTDLLEKRISEESAATRARITEEGATTRARIAEEGATTRAHFDIMVERMEVTSEALTRGCNAPTC